MESKPNNAKDIFAEALDKDPRERVPFLARACEGDTALRHEVDSLLSAYDQAEGFMPSPDLDLPVTLDSAPLTEGPGSVIGRYKLLEKIGEGGMAVVYMAQQERPIRRKVALKIIKLGMDTRQVIARFEAERQALAMMDHLNIAKVLDAGATETGRPYFVMELVQGVAITEYCDKNKLNTDRRLILFVQVCSAVHHAHQKGIIHRDIKPTNVMVTLHDGKPVPKVIDFGIAKAMNQRLTEKTLFTRYGHMVGTPAYMSPEQAEMSGLDIDTRTDVYSLGVLLYELLTGTTPFDAETLRDAGYVEMQRILHEEDPDRPSTKLSTLGDMQAQIAEFRNTKPDMLSRLIRGDLDWIAMKSLDKDRTRRYDSASALALDVQRHLDNEPVLARSPKALYQLQTFLRRNRIPVVAALTIVVFIASVGVILYMWNEDRHQLAQDRARLAEAESLRHGSILSQARGLLAQGDRKTALILIKSDLDTQPIHPDTRLLYAGILVEERRYDEGLTTLESLLEERPEIAGAAHSLQARILWESKTLDAGTLQAVETHRRKAEELLPETAEAYFLRAMTAITIKEKLDLLDKAIRLDPRHYESFRLRAFIYSASRKYQEMKEDALVMVSLRPQDPLGYSLRAAARFELGQYEKAIEDYGTAIEYSAEDDPQVTKLHIRRYDVMLRMGEYERVIREARENLEQASYPLPHEFRIFSALIALGNYEEANVLYERMIDFNPASRGWLSNWSRKYVFDTLDVGRSWHPQDAVPEGKAFLVMLEADETYHRLSAKAKRVVIDAFTAHWSPDGTKLAFSTGFLGYSGVAVWDAATGETDLLIVPGKDPEWSPDGRYLAFVRDCEALPVSELAAANRANRHRSFEDEQVWIMDANGTEPRRLISGNWPCWSRDPNQIFFYSQNEGAICKITIDETSAKAQRVLKCPDRLSEISPDGRFVACTEGKCMKLFELVSGSLVTEWVFPSTLQGKTWSSDSRELCFGASHFEGIMSGLWVYDLGTKKTRKVLDGPVSPSSLAPDRTKLVFNLPSPYFEIWAADLDPNVDMVESLGSSLMLGEYFQEKLTLYAQRIKANPEDANNYFRRAQYHEFLGDRASANADMRRWSAVAQGRQPSDLQYSTRPDLRHVLGTPTSILLQYLGPSVSTDGLTLYLDAPPVLGGYGDNDIWISTRDTIDDEWSEPVNAGPLINSSFADGNPDISADGLTLFFNSRRPGYGDQDIWLSTRVTTDESWSEPVNLGPPVNGPYFDSQPSVSTDGLSLYFSSTRPGGYGEEDTWLSTRATTNDPWSEPVNLGPIVNSPSWDRGPDISSDGLRLFFDSDRPGGYGEKDIWLTTRTTTEAPWSEPVNLGPIVNSPAREINVCISAHGSTLYFFTARIGSELRQVSITPPSDVFQEDDHDELDQKSK